MFTNRLLHFCLQKSCPSWNGSCDCVFAKSVEHCPDRLEKKVIKKQEELLQLIDISVDL